MSQAQIELTENPGDKDPFRRKQQRAVGGRKEVKEDAEGK